MITTTVDALWLGAVLGFSFGMVQPAAAAFSTYLLKRWREYRE